MKEQSTTDVFKKVTGMSIGLAILMIVLGFLAVALPLATGIGVSILVGWIVVFGGFTYVAYAFAAQGAGAFLWRMLIGIVYVAGGFYLVFHPATRIDVSHISAGCHLGSRRRAADDRVFPVPLPAGFRMGPL